MTDLDIKIGWWARRLEEGREKEDLKPMVKLAEEMLAAISKLNDGLNNRAVLALSLAADGTVLYAAIDGGGVYRLGRPRQINYLPLVTRR